MIQSGRTSLIFRNPKPHLRAVNAWHPTLVQNGLGHLAATFDLGQAAESLDYRTYISRSIDGGQTWDAPAPLFPDDLLVHPTRRTTHTARPMQTSNGQWVALIGRYYRDDVNEGIINNANLGMVEMDLMLARSNDEGRSWQEASVIEPPLVGPAFEVAHPIVEFTDGRWWMPLSTWKDWDGQAPNGMKSVALVSTDQGKTWPKYVDIMDDYANGIIHWEQSVVQLADGRLLAVAWAFNERTGKTKAVHYAISNDTQCFSNPPLPTELAGETAKLLALPDGRAICVYRGIDPPGLCAVVVELDGDQWHHGDPVPLWQGTTPTKMAGQVSAGEELAALKLGYPSPMLLPDGEVLVAFWCYEDQVYNIRCVRFHV